MYQFLFGKPLVKNTFFKSFPKIRLDGEFGFDLKNPDKEQLYGFKNSDLDSRPLKTHPLFQQVILMGHKIATKEMKKESPFPGAYSVKDLFSH